MGRPYNRDLRERVVEAAGATSHRQAAAHFGVGVATAIRWMAALTTTGTVAARPRGRALRSKLDPLEAFLRALIAVKDTSLWRRCVPAGETSTISRWGWVGCGASSTRAA